MTESPESVGLIPIGSFGDGEGGEENEQDQGDQSGGPSQVTSNGWFVRSFPPKVERLLCVWHQRVAPERSPRM